MYHFEKISPLNDTQRAESDLGRHLCSEPSVSYKLHNDCSGGNISNCYTGCFSRAAISGRARSKVTTKF